MFDESLGKSTAGGAPNSPDVVAGKGGHAGELAKTMVAGELEGGQQAPGMTIPVLSQGEGGNLSKEERAWNALLSTGFPLDIPLTSR